jgi:hypothetical protein
MPMTPDSIALGHEISVLVEFILLYSLAVCALGVACGVAAGYERRDPLKSSRRRAVDMDGFVKALAGRDFELADLEAARVLRVNDHERRGRRWRSVRDRLRRLRLLERRGHPPLELFDACAVLRCRMSEFTSFFDDPARLAEWFPVVRQPDDASIVVGTRDRVLQLHGVVERWQPEAGTLHTDAYIADGSPLRGYLTIRAAMSTTLGPMRQGVQIWVHIELPANRCGRKALACLKPAVEQGLRRLEAEFDAR